MSVPLRLVLAVLVLLAVVRVSQAAIVVEAPAPLDALLGRYLDLATDPDSSTDAGSVERRLHQQAADLLAVEGYYSADIVLRQQASGWQLQVTPGPRTLVDSVVIRFQGALADPGQSARRDALQSQWRLPVGSAFRSADWEAAKTALLTATADEDYATARIATSKAEVDPQTAKASLQVVIDSGPAWRFGTLVVDGLHRYDATLVQRYAPFAPGARYRRADLLQWQSRLQNTPWFHSVTVAVQTAEAHDALLPVRITLAESTSRRVGLGAGYGTDTGANGEVDLRDRDFLGHAWDFASTLQLEQRRQLLSGELALRPDAAGYQPSVGARYERTDIQGLDTLRRVVSVARSRTDDGTEARLGLEWQDESRRPAGGQAEKFQALTLDWRRVWRRVDTPLDPRSGHLLELRIGGASSQLLSDTDFVRVYGRAQQWWPVTGWGERDVATLRGEVGYTAAASRFGIPQDYLFRAGGAQSVRGSAYQSLGVQEAGAVVGGRALATVSAEYTHWLGARPWGVAFFADAGDAADDWNTLHAAIGVGTGLRWKSPAGPVALDLARDVRRDGKPGAWYVHFSLLVAF